MKFFSVVFVLLLSVSLLAQTDAGVTGKWQFAFETEDGIRNADADLRVEGQNVTGKLGESDVKGTFADGKFDLTFSMHSEEAGFTATMKMTGKAEGDGLTGKWEFGQYTGTFKAKRKE